MKIRNQFALIESKESSENCANCAYRTPTRKSIHQKDLGADIIDKFPIKEFSPTIFLFSPYFFAF